MPEADGITLAASEDETADLIRRAPTDGERLITYLDSVLDAGNAHARALADRTLAQVHDLLGMGYADRR